MAKNLNISMTFTADTSQAKKEMKSLQDQLSKLGSNIDFGKGIGKQFVKDTQEAQKSIAALQVSLQSAFNVDTGKLDFTKFNTTLKKSGHELSNYYDLLKQMGPEGEKAFMDLTNAVAKSEVPIIRVSDKLKSLGTTLANTARWQISSSVLHGFMGAIQTAYGYAQDLNRSLNDIRIVTGYSADEMAKFAEQANKSAQALSTTTTAYTDAALIFYQQGLSDEEVQKRTDATIKMANVTGENAEHVSSYMTAIWNNFADGSKSLEYYADVMTQLGAATAASSEEIAEGMEKFAAVGETVGLSYEYAAAAVTTVIDKTRQSADIVGTSFKTIFARLEGLQLGETLEDGTTLNKYSKALATVGINIKEQNGELKDMDQILDEMGAKWETLSKDQQVALAQTVGGVRQYTQLIALMDNFDAFKENVQLGLDSEGTLQEQQDIYAESWEASIDRVRAAWEALQSDIIKDDVFIWLNDVLTSFLQGLDKFIDGLGGVKGLLVNIVPLITQIFGGKIVEQAKNIGYSLRMMAGGRDAAIKERNDQFSKLKEHAGDVIKDPNTKAAFDSHLDYLETRAKYEKYFTKEELEQYDLMQKMREEQLKLNQAQEEDLKKTQKRTEYLKDKAKVKEKELFNNYNLTESAKEDIKKIGDKSELRSRFIGSLTYSDDKATQLASMQNAQKLYRKNESVFKEYFDALGLDGDNFRDMNMGAQGEELTEEAEQKVLDLYEHIIIDIGDELKSKSAKLDEKELKKVTKTLSQDQIADAREKEKQRLRDSKKIDSNIHDAAVALTTKETTKIASRSTLKGAITKYEHTLEEMAAAGKENTDDYKELKIRIENAKKSLEEITQQEKEVDKALEEYEQSIIEENIDDAQEYIDTKRSAGAAAGAVDKIQGEQERRNAAKGSKDVSNSMEDEGAKRLKDAKPGERFAAIGQAALTATASVNSLRSAFAMFGDETATTGQKIEGIVVALPMVTMGVASITGALKSLNIIGNVTKATFIEITAVIMAIAGVMTIVNHVTEQRNKDLEEQIELEQKHLDKLKEEQEANKNIEEQAELMKQLNLQYKNGNLEKEEYADKLLEVANNLEIENAQLYVQIGHYERLNQLIDEKQRKEREEAEKNIGKSAKGIQSELYKAADKNLTFEEDYAEISDGKIYFDVDVSKYFKNGERNEDFRSDDTEILKYLQKNGLEKYINLDLGNKDEQGYQALLGYSIDIASMDTEALLKFYELMQDIIDHASEFGGSSTQTRKAIDELYEAIGEEDWESNIALLKQNLELEKSINLSKKLDEIDVSTLETGNYASIHKLFTSSLEGIPEEDVEEFQKLVIQKMTAVDPETVNKYVIVKDAYDALGLDIDHFLDDLNPEQQELVYNSIIDNYNGFASIVLSNSGDVSASLEELQTSFDLINTTSAVEQVNNLVKALDSIKSGDVKTNEEWAELLGEDFLEQFGEYFVETATGTMFIGSEQDKMQLQNDIQSRNYGKSKAEYDAEIDKEIEKNNKEWDAAKKEREEYANSEINVSTFNDYRNGQNSKNLDKFESWQAGTTLTELLSDKNASFMLKSILGEEQFEEFKKSLSTEELNTFFSAYDADLKAAKESYDAYAFTVETSYADIKKQVSQYGTLVNREEGKVQVAIRRSAQEYGLAADEIVEYGKYLDENNKYLKDNAIMADAVALAYSRADKGLQDLNSNFETWNKALADNTEDSKEYAEAMDGFETALQNIFNTEEDISNDFILSHLEDIQKAAEGDLEAITDLQIAFAQDANIDWNTLESRMGKDFQAAMDEVEWGSIEVGASVETDDMLNKWFTAMNNMVMSGEMSADEMQSIWNSLGFELEPITKKITIASLQGGWWDGSKYVQPEDQVKEVVIGFKAKGSSYTGTNAVASKISNNKGGGKGGSSKGSKEKDYEKERYYTITRQIQDATDAFNEYEKAKDRAAGKAKVGYIDFELENLKERQRLQKEYLKEIEDYYKQDQAKLNFFGATYDENGVLTNYDEIFNRLQQKYKDAVASGSEEAINAAQQDLDAFIAAANQFDKTNQLYQSEMIKDAELAREEIDKTIEKIDTTLTLKVEIDDRSLKLLEYQLGRIEGGAFTQGAQMANRQAQLNLQLDEQAATRQALDDLLKQNKLTENDLATKTPEELVALGIDDKVLEKMKEYADKLLEIQGNIDGLEEAILGGALEAFEEFNAEFDYQSKIIEHQTKLLKSYKDIAELVYGNAGLDEGFMIDLMGTSQETMLARTAATRTKLEADKQALAKAREAFANYSGGDEKVQKQLEEDVRSMEETVMQGEEDLLSQTQENLQQAKEIFDRTLEAAKQDYLKAVGADDWSMTLFDRATKIDDQYLDDYEKIYHLAKLTRDVNNSIDDTPAFRGKERLREVTEEILELEKEGVKVSQYQVDALRAKYELRLAEIALEDAQNAKSTVRMARDNEGNWSYVYTSDADDVDKAKQNYEDKLYEYQKLNTDYVKKQQKTYMDLAREAGDAITQIANNSKLDPAVQDEMIAETEAYYSELMGITTSELELALGYNKDLYEKDWASYNKYTGYKISADQNYIDKFDETILGEITGLKSTQEAYQNWADALAGDSGFIPAVGNALDDLAEAQNRALEILGTDLDDFAGHVGAAMTNAIDETENAKNAIEDNAKQMEDFFNSLVDAIKKLNDLRINDKRDDITNFVNNINLMVKAYNDLAEAKKKASDVPSTPEITPPIRNDRDGSENGNGGGNGGDGNKTNLNELDSRHSLYKIFYDLGYRKSSNNQLIADYMNAIEQARDDNAREKIYNDFMDKNKNSSLFSLLKMKGQVVSSFDTGGYTGSWGDSGRLAFLHQKELVLNAQDTANMLQMTNMVRELSEYIDFQAAATNLGRVSTTIGSVGVLAGGELNQNVHIEATFPNVSEAYEIEEALTNLVNRAAQYANRK